MSLPDGYTSRPLLPPAGHMGTVEISDAEFDRIRDEVRAKGGLYIPSMVLGEEEMTVSLVLRRRPRE